MLHKFLRGYFMSGPINHLWNSKEIYIVTVQQVHIKDIMCDESEKGINSIQGYSVWNHMGVITIDFVQRKLSSGLQQNVFNQR